MYEIRTLIVENKFLVYAFDEVINLISIKINNEYY